MLFTIYLFCIRNARVVEVIFEQVLSGKTPDLIKLNYCLGTSRSCQKYQ